MIRPDAYAAAVDLYEPFVPAPAEAEVDAARREAVAWLLAERGTSVAAPAVDTELDVLLRDMLTVRPPAPFTARVQVCLDAVFAAKACARGSVGPGEILAGPGETRVIAGTPVKVWRGDITRLAVDAIVNAANAELLGCFRPGHACIDNAIHSAAGPRLREDCARIIHIQGHAERSGTAKITRAYYLPSRFVLHTVGPIVAGGRVQPEDERTLGSAYHSCLELAHATQSIRSLAFCAISTGVFGYPKDRAADVAVRTVSRWLHERPKTFDLVVFCVFSEVDERAYEQAMAAGGEGRVA